MTPERNDPPTVLIVESDQSLLESVDHFLSARYTTRTASEGDEALERLDDSVDVAVLGRRLADQSGTELLEAMREQGHRFPVAMVTAVEPDRAMIDPEFDEYLLRPVERKPLLNRVELLIQRKEFDEKSREFFRLASRKAALESNEAVTAGPDPEIRELADRMEALRAELDGTLQTLIDEDPAQPFEFIERTGRTCG